MTFDDIIRKFTIWLSSALRGSGGGRKTNSKCTFLQLGRLLPPLLKFFHDSNAFYELRLAPTVDTKIRKSPSLSFLLEP